MAFVQDTGPPIHARRALVLMAAALASMLVTGVLYLRANPPLPVHLAKPTLAPPTLAGYGATYDFISPDRGWALMETRAPLFWVYGTANGGQTWQRLYTGVGVTGPTSVHFFDQTNGVISIFSSDSVALRTSDGGVHWESVALPSPVSLATFADPMHGWVLSADSGPLLPSHLFTTADGGATWTAGTWPSGVTLYGTQSHFEFRFRSNGEGWLGTGGVQPSVLLSLDGGRSWGSRSIEIPFHASWEQAPNARASASTGAPRYTTEVNLLPGQGVIAFVTDSLGRGLGLTTFDQGRSWRAINSLPSPGMFKDLAYLDATHWWALSSGLLVKTADGGHTWSKTRIAWSMTHWSCRTVHLIDPTHAWCNLAFDRQLPISALGMTSDGGASWKTVNVPNPDQG